MYACKYVQNIYCMCVLLYIHNEYTQYTYIYYVNKNFYLNVIDRLTALVVYLYLERMCKCTFYLLNCIYIIIVSKIQFLWE